jgi:hypothetical protein
MVFSFGGHPIGGAMERILGFALGVFNFILMMLDIHRGDE